MRRPALMQILLLLMAGCHAPADKSEDQQPKAIATPRAIPTSMAAPAPPAPIEFAPVMDGSARYSMRSSIDGMYLFAAKSLPRIEHATDSPDWCDKWGTFAPETPAGKLAVSQGWKITGEERLGPLTALSIIRKYEPAPGAMCVAIDGYAVFFEGTNVVGALHRDQQAWFSVGRLEKLESGALRIWTSTTQAPLGDLTLKGHQISLGPTAAMNSECAGRMKVPGLFRMPIERAHKILLGSGWRPLRMGNINRDSSEYWRYYRRGITEIDSCTASGRCLFHYQSAAGNLTLETWMPEAPDSAYRVKEWVIFYAAECKTPLGKVQLKFNTPSEHSRYF